MPVECTAKSAARSKATATSGRSKAVEAQALRDKKKEWSDSLVPWVKDKKFRWPQCTICMFKTDAKKAYKLDESDMSTLVHETLPNSNKTYFKQSDVLALADRKSMALYDVPFDRTLAASAIFLEKTGSHVGTRYGKRDFAFYTPPPPTDDPMALLQWTRNLDIIAERKEMAAIDRNPYAGW